MGDYQLGNERLPGMAFYLSLTLRVRMSQNLITRSRGCSSPQQAGIASGTTGLQAATTAATTARQAADRTATTDPQAAQKKSDAETARGQAQAAQASSLYM
ncbi:hypothetical protein DdX_17690 [Ditylenchus destructor]|uniref:Uncharacterized protein n=1 Tax=Ditylenchus destructor TaxID=166010 RepID=A0AAD4QT98_9BILA|nr:hypothetical protein DdX_17690 [Ditylenchus destructor]